MNIYFVRHGESTENRDKIIDWMESSLTENGVRQAEIVAQRFKKIKLDKIICSDMTRAIQTAEIINKYHNLEVEKNPLVREQNLPSELLKMNEEHSIAKNAIKLIRDNIHNKNYRYSDEETFHEFWERLLKFFKYIEGLDLQNVLIIGHGFVLRSVVGYVLFGKDYSSYNFVKLRDNFKTTNTGVTLCEFNKKNGWKLLSWNDHAHLAE